MNSAMSWSVKGIEPEVRAAAKTAARKSGQTMGQWLNSLILDMADHEVDHKADFGRDGEFAIPGTTTQHSGHAYENRIDQLERELAQLTHRQSETAIPRRFGAGAIADPDATPLQHLLERLDRNERETVRAFEAMHDRMGSLSDEIVESRVDAVDENGAGEQVARNEAFEHALKNVVDHMEHSDRATRDILSEINARLEDLDQQVTTGAHGSESANKKILGDVERRLTALAHRVDQVGEADHNEFQQNLETQISLLAKQVEHVAAETTAPMPDGMADQLSDLQHRIEVTEQVANQAHAEVQEAIGQRLAHIGERLDSVHATSVRTAEQAAKSVVASTQGEFREIEGQVRQLAAQIQDTAALDPQTEQTLSQLMQQTSSLSQDVQQIKVEAASESDVQSLRSMVDNLSNVVEQQFSNATHDQDFAALEQRLAEVSQRIDQTAATAQQSPDMENLERRVHEMDARMAASQADSQSDELLTSLGQQIDGLTQRVTESEQQHSGIQAIEKSISQLFESVEQTRTSASEAAEQAAGRIVDQMRAEGTGSDGNPATLVALEQGLQALKASAEGADQRNQETLEAVHDTLEKVITRLVALEEAPGAGTHGAQSHSPGATPDATAPANGLADLQLPPIPPMPSPQGFGGENAETGEEPSWKATVDAKSAEQMEEIFADGMPQLPPLGEVPASETVPADDAAALAAPGAAAPETHTATKRNDFIAAARRAAQAAQDGSDTPADGGTLKSLRRRRRGAGGDTDSGAKNGRRRPLILAAIVLLMIGAVSAYKIVGGKQIASGPAQISTPVSTQTEPEEEGIPAPEPDTPETAAEPEKQSRAVTPGSNAIADIQVPAPGDPIAATRTTKEMEKQSLASPISRSPESDAVTTGSVNPAQTSAKDDLMVPTDPLLMALPLMKSPAAKAPVAQREEPEVEQVTSLTRATPAPAVPVTPVTKKPISNLKNLPPANVGPLGMRIAAANGDAVAQFLIATAYTEGGTVPQDFRKAAQWYQKSAGRGLAPAQYRLGTFYEKGKGVPEDLAAARIWYERAAEKGNRKAMHNLAVIYADGSRGTPDFTKAGTWFRSAAELGLKDSQYNLGILHERGLGVSKDLGQAYKWFSLAAKQGDADAASRMTRIENRLAPQTLIEAKLAVQNWSAKPVNVAANKITPPADGWKSVASDVNPEKLASRQMIAETQALLNRLGYSAGPSDGLSGGRTRDAIRYFQKANDMVETGAVTPKLLAVLRKKTS